MGTYRGIIREIKIWIAFHREPTIEISLRAIRPAIRPKNSDYYSRYQILPGLSSRTSFRLAFWYGASLGGTKTS